MEIVKSNSGRDSLVLNGTVVELGDIYTIIKSDDKQTIEFIQFDDTTHKIEFVTKAEYDSVIETITSTHRFW